MIKKVPVVKYLPYEDRPTNSEYYNALRRIWDEGTTRNPEFHNGTVIKFFTNVMKFNMREGFPIITERKISTANGDSEKMMRWAIAEIIGFIHGATTLSELEKFGLPKFWWRRWVESSHIQSSDGIKYFNLPETDIGEHLGRFSYGGIWGRFPTMDGGETNQWENVILQMIKSPTAFTHRVTNWYPPGIIAPKGQGKRQVVVAPCHGDVQIELDPENRILTLIHLQRSADVPVGVPYNMIHYPAIGMMLACVLGYTFETYHHVMIDSHFYVEKQEENVKILLTREPMRLPTVTLDFEPTGDPVKDFFAIRPEHFHLSDYYSHPYMKIETEL